MIPRYRCNTCRKTFSSSRLTPCYLQKKRTLNATVEKLLCSAVSLRRTALLLNINRKTVVRKLLFIGAQAKVDRLHMLEDFKHAEQKISAIQFDEMETCERTKCLPLSIPLVVNAKNRKVLGFAVAQMPAKGLLAKISVKKYGKREDHREKKAAQMFSEIKDAVSEEVEITTDKKSCYPEWLKPHFPKATHKTTKGRRGCGGGQGELKKIGFDPLFSLNHTAAMFRANINRLFRRTWCVTKRADRLEAHIEMYIRFHNTLLTEPEGMSA